MTNIVALLREAAAIAYRYAVLHKETATDDTLSLPDRLRAAADELEASAEWALCKWLAEDKRRLADVWIKSTGRFVVRLQSGHEPALFSESYLDRADAIRAAIRAWEER